MSLTPRAAGIAAIAAIVIFAGTAIAVLPAASTDAQNGPGAGQATSAQVEVGVLARDLWRSAWPTPTPVPATATPTAEPTATPTPSPTPTPTPTPKPKPKVTAKPRPRVVVYPDTVAGARAYIRAQVGNHQYDCISNIFQKESKWNPQAGRLTGAYGIPQAFPGSKMGAFGSNWRTSPLTQVKWGIWYVWDRYGSACNAWLFWQAHGWY